MKLFFHEGGGGEWIIFVWDHRLTLKLIENNQGNERKKEGKKEKVVECIE